MNCPNCGGAMEYRDAARCFSCGHCGTVHFPEPAPGDVTVLGTEEPAPLCPSCHEPLSRATIGGEAIHYCTRCRGMLLDRGTFVTVVQTKRAWASNAPTEPRPVDRREMERSISCPRCRARMATHPYYGPGNIVIDTCESCDLVWLDAGELQRVVDAPGRDRGSSLRAGEGAWPQPETEPPIEEDGERTRMPLFDLLFGISYPGRRTDRES